MTANAFAASIRTVDLLVELGFVDAGYELRWQHEGIGIAATEGLTQQMVQAVHIGGIVNTARSSCMIDFDLPSKLENRGQGLALMAYALRDCTFTEPPSWLIEGQNQSDQLPWERVRSAHRASPRCTVQRESFRLINKRLRELAVASASTATSTWGFDGRLLSIDLAADRLTTPAVGEAWDTVLRIELSRFRFLPKRLMHHTIDIFMHEGYLAVDNRRFPLLGNAEP